MDISNAAAPRSDQQNYEDYIAGPKTVTISEIRRGSDEQPVEVHLVEFPGRPFKPSKTVLRIFIIGWGPETDAWVGRRATLFGDPTVKWGGVAVGGVRVSHLSNIDKPFKVALTETRGKKQMHSIDPLPDLPPARDWSLEVESAETVEALRALWKHAGANLHARIAERVAELQEMTA